MRLTRESETKKRKQTKEGKKHSDHIPAYMKEEMHDTTLADLFMKRNKH